MAAKKKLPKLRKVGKGSKAKVAKGRCARPGKLGSRARRQLPDNAFAIPSKRTYPLYRMGADGKLVPSTTHAISAKGRARQAFDAGRIGWITYLSIVRKANKVIARCKVNAAKKKEVARKKAAKKRAAKKKAKR